MRSLTRHIAAGAAGLLGVAMVLGSGPIAHAAGGPPWEPDPQGMGTIAFYDATGTVVTSGSIDDAPIAAYAVASATIRGGDARAILVAAQPNPNDSTANWNADTLSAVTSYPITTGPADIKSMTHPVVTGASGDLTIDDFISEFPNTGPGGAGCAYETTPGNPSTCTNTSYENIYQLRIKTLNTGGFQTANYAVADVLVSGTTWTQVFPVPGTPTTTTLAVAPANQIKQHQSVTLTATVALTADATTHPAGTVQFRDGATKIGGAVTVNTSTGIASLTSTALFPSAPNGASLTAAFTPGDSSIAVSTSTPANYTVNPVAAKPTITGKARVGTAVSCTEATSAGETAAYGWSVGAKKVASGKTLKIPASADKKKLACTVTVHDGAGPASSATSKAVIVALGKALKASKKPKLSGPHKAGAKEKVGHGRWSPAASSYSYQWLEGHKKIKGATKSSLTLKASEKGKTITCRVTAHKVGYANGTATSKGVKVS